jgi:hypothetical protein
MDPASLDTPILTFARGHFVLSHDLDCLDRVSRAQAPEAAVFYAGRILEILAAQAVEDLEMPPHGTLLANLDLLEQYNLVPVTARYCAHALRRMANDARHILRPITPADAELAHLFVMLALEWYFKMYPFGPQRIDLQTPAAAVLHGLLAQCAAAEASALITHITQDANLGKSAAIPAVVAEALLDGGRLDAARAVVGDGLARFPGDARLLLLQGLHLSRSDDAAGALAILEPLFRKYPGDAEAAGILAGVYKRLWLRERRNAPLKRSHETYLAGWKASRETSAYLGSNAAATALWLGRTELARTLAQSVLELLTARMQRLRKKIADPEASMGLWNAAIVAELQLLSGDLDAAKNSYARLFTRHADKRGGIEVARKQAELILEQSGPIPPSFFSV